MKHENPTTLPAITLIALGLAGPAFQGAAFAAPVGILQTGEQAGHYFEYNGKPLMLVGDSVTQGWMESGTAFNQNAYVDALASRGINLLMLWAYIGTSASQQQGDERIGYNAPEIWPWVGSPDQGNFDLGQLNQAYFTRLAALVAYAETKDIIVLITLHDGWTKTRFAAHPFNTAIGNGPLTASSQYVELANYDAEMPAAYNSSWNRQQRNQYYQERFAAKLISELAPYDNVIYEMFNEGEWYDSTMRRRHEQHFLAFFRARCDNLLLSNSDHISGDTPQTDSKVDVITEHGDWTGRFGEYASGFGASPAKPMMLDEPIPEFRGDNLTIATIRRSVWEVTLAGGGWAGQNDASFSWNPQVDIVAQANARDQFYDSVGHCARFLNSGKVDFPNMRPAGSLASTGVCLARAGSSYLVYAANGGTFTVNLSAASGKTLGVQWYNPRTGETSQGADVAGGSASASFTAPFSGDAVLFVGGEPAEDLTPTWVDNTHAASGATYSWGILATGQLVYVDRTFPFTDPASLTGQAYLRTANADKAAVLNPFVTFDVTVPVTVYVAHDSRLTLPTWLTGWDDAADDLVSADATLHLFSRNFAAGAVTLGPNAATTTGSMYSVVVVPQGDTPDTGPGADGDQEDDGNPPPDGGPQTDESQSGDDPQQADDDDGELSNQEIIGGCGAIRGEDNLSISLAVAGLALVFAHSPRRRRNCSMTTSRKDMP
jgi:hypothetical protein